LSVTAAALSAALPAEGDAASRGHAAVDRSRKAKTKHLPAGIDIPFRLI